MLCPYLSDDLYEQMKKSGWGIKKKHHGGGGATDTIDTEFQLVFFLQAAPPRSKVSKQRTGRKRFGMVVFPFVEIIAEGPGGGSPHPLAPPIGVLCTLCTIFAGYQIDIRFPVYFGFFLCSPKFVTKIKFNNYSPLFPVSSLFQS